jgi:hypothetical protein
MHGVEIHLAAIGQGNAKFEVNLPTLMDTRGERVLLPWLTLVFH